MKFIDDFLNQITMYRLVLYYLIVLLVVAVVFSFFGVLNYSPWAIIASTFFLLAVCWITNKIFAIVFEAPTNFESVYITALILALIIKPTLSSQLFVFLAWAGIWAMAAKYIFAIGRKHLFNPVAIAVVITMFGINQTASWWVGTAVMAPFVLLGGLLVVRKIQREAMVGTFFVVAIVTAGVISFLNHGTMLTNVQKILLDSSLLFLGFVMLTEPLTTPPTRNLQIIYGAIVGFFFVPQVHIGSLYFTPELALVVGNVFSYFVSPKQKLLLQLKEKIATSPDMMDFLFITDKQMTFRPGQYMEWTLPHKHMDSRGNRRYFTIASSPTEDILRLGVKLNKHGSSFKKALDALDGKSQLVAAQLAGDFTLSKDPKQKMVFIAGGIGITPFRSMIKYLLDTKQTRSIVLLYAAKTPDDIIYRDVFDQAEKELGTKVIYTLTNPSEVPPKWKGMTGRITQEMVEKEIPDYKERHFYLSGPHDMVTKFEQTLLSLGVHRRQIKKDFFPGFV